MALPRPRYPSIAPWREINALGHHGRFTVETGPGEISTLPFLLKDSEKKNVIFRAYVNVPGGMIFTQKTL